MCYFSVAYVNVSCFLFVFSIDVNKISCTRKVDNERR